MIAYHLIAELLKRKAETDKTIAKKIKERRAQLSKGERFNRNRLFMLTGVAYHTDANLHPELNSEIKATLDRAITNPRIGSF